MSQKVYMPLMIGDWLKGTRGMKAEVRGVYLNLLLFQWDNGYIPADMDELLLIDPELGKVWDKIRDKFIEIEPGRLQNKKNEEVRNFWKKQKSNGSKGGRPKKGNPNPNPEENPNPNLHNDLDLDNDLNDEVKEGVQGKPLEDVDQLLSTGLNEIYLDQEQMKWPHLDFSYELETFRNKVRGSPDEYRNRDAGGIRLAFQYQLRNSKGKPKNGTSTNKSTDHLSSLMEGYQRRHGGAASK
jgi:uncharacterized protein YdaU (DUF1376 family)